MSLPYDDPAVTAYALDEVGPQEKARVEGLVEGSPQAQAALEETRLVARLVEEAYRAEPAHVGPSAGAVAPGSKAAPPAEPLFDRIVSAPPETAPPGGGARLRMLALPLAAATALVLGASIWWVVEKKAAPAGGERPPVSISAAAGVGPGLGSAGSPPAAAPVPPPPLPDSAFDVHPATPARSGGGAPFENPLVPADGGPAAPLPPPAPTPKAAAVASLESDEAARAIQKEKLDELRAKVMTERSGAASPPPPAPSAFPELVVPAAKTPRPVALGAPGSGDDGQFQFTPGPLQAVTAPVVTGFALPEVLPVSGAPAPVPEGGAAEEGPGVKMVDFGADLRAPLPFVLLSRVLPSPWSPGRDLIVIALQPVAAGQTEPSRANLVFLVDISVSMNAPDRLPMFKEAFNRFLDGLRPEDQVALVVYSGDSARWLGTTPVHERETIRRAFNRLATTETGRPGASLQMAYDLAHQGFIPGGFNRVIAITDGDLDLGVGESGGLYDYVAQQARDGVTLSLIGVGREFTNSSKVRQLVRSGRGMAAATRTAGGLQIALDREVTSSSPMAVRNLKLELPLTADRVSAYRLLGYQNQFPVTGSGLGPRPGAGLLACYETERGSDDPPRQPDVALRYHRSGDADQGEETQSAPVGAPDRAAPEIVRDFEQQVADLRARFKALPVAEGKEAKPEPAMPVDAAAPGAKAVNKQDYQDFRKAAESWIEPVKKAD